MNREPFCEFCGNEIVDGEEHNCPEMQDQQSQVPEAAPQSPQQQNYPYEEQLYYPPAKPRNNPGFERPQAPRRPAPQYEYQDEQRRPSYPHPPRRQTQVSRGGRMDRMKDLSGQGFNTAKLFFKSPSKTMQMANHAGSFQQGLFFYAVKAVLMGIIAPLLLSSALKELIWPFYRDGLEFSDYLSIFLRVALFSVVADAAYLGVTLLAGKLFKSPADYRSLVGILGVCSIPLTCAIAAGGILAMISLKLGVIVFIAILCYCAAVNYQSLEHALMLNNKDQLILAMAVIFLAMVALSYIAGKSFLEDLTYGTPYFR